MSVRMKKKLIYLEGIEESLEKQGTELMIVVPKEIEESYADIAVGFKTKLNTLSYEEGRKTGKSTIMSRGIEGTV